MFCGAGRAALSVRCLRLLALLGIAALLVRTSVTFAQSYEVDAANTRYLTTYLRQHRLPLVGAQVLSDAAGNRRIVLYGFVATEFGKNDAAAKALAFVQNEAQAGAAAPQLENRIEIRPEIGRMKPEATMGEAAVSGSKSLDQVLDEIGRYGVTMAPAGPSPR
jgi:hypothetical protein